jgi:hypothetical protein
LADVRYWYLADFPVAATAFGGKAEIA